VTVKKSAAEVFHAYLTRDRIVSGGYVIFNWTVDGSGLWFIDGDPGDPKILRVDLATGVVEPAFDVDKVRAQLAAATGREPPHHGIPPGKVALRKDGRLEFVYGAYKWQLDPLTGKLGSSGDVSEFMKVLGWTGDDEPTPRLWRRSDYLSITTNVPEQLSPSGESFVSVRSNDLVLRASTHRDYVGRQLTFNGTAECFWDIEAPRVKVLAGRRLAYGGVTPWSPDSLTLLAYQRDVTGVFRIPRTHWLSSFEEAERLPYQKAGAKLDVISPVFVDVRSGQQTPVRLAEIEDRYIQLLGWHPHGHEALIIVYSRDFRRLEIISSNRENGVVRPVLTESGDTFVKVWHDSVFSGEHGFKVLPDGSGFLWLSTRDGWNHLYHYDMSGRLVGRLTSGDWPVHEISHVGADGRIYFTASIDKTRPYDVHVCRVALNGSGLEQLTRERGIHTPVFAPAGHSFVDTHSTVDRPIRSDLVRADGTLVRTLSKMNISRLEAMGYNAPEEFIVKAADGMTDLWGVLYKPFNFEAARRYPVIEYIYGGPQTIETPRYFAVDPSMLSSMNIPWALAQLGYVVVCLDARGTPGRSKAFHDVVYGNWSAGLPDHASAIHQLCERHTWMDRARVGIYGHSWGGYFATLALIEAPDTYCAAVSYAPGYSPWDSVLYEPYLDLPLRNRAAYEKADITNHAPRVSGALMIVAGTSDPHVGSALRFTRALIDAGIDHEFVAVPDAFHHFVGVEEDYLLMKLAGWFERHVKSRDVEK
jgi:dipeptidyl-peptidase 4